MVALFAASVFVEFMVVEVAVVEVLSTVDVPVVVDVPAVVVEVLASHDFVGSTVAV